eukprot:TRINITY_DN4534_c0_g4_i1.p1 TRINITY_DN4534_c0_g4~~TRINITY_DN4534_c0_g4_i1.p1  ORF type:complete len:235 (+),score=32.03 TRINITY_DN4534_c0_g4_i1:92-796(+)
MKKLKENRSKSINLPQALKRQSKLSSDKSFNKRSLHEGRKSTDEGEDSVDFNCANCRATLINSNLISRPHVVVHEASRTGSERKVNVQVCVYGYGEDEGYFIFSSLVPNVLHNGEVERPGSEGVYYLLKCKVCMHILGKHFIFSQNKAYEGKYCLMRSAVFVTLHKNAEDIKKQIAAVKKKRLEIDGKIISLAKKVVRKINATMALVRSHDKEYKTIATRIEELKKAVLAMDDN